MSNRFLESALAHLPALFRSGRRLTRSDAEAEDLVQDTLVRAMETASQAKSEASLRAWLLAVQRTVFFNSRRGKARHLTVVGEVPEDVLVGDLEADVTRLGITDELAAALATLPAEWRDVVWLREVDELSYDEIARVVGCPVGTVRSRLARGREALQKALEDQKKKERCDGSV